MARVLVVEDDPVSRKVVSTVLEKTGHAVTACGSGLAAIEVLIASEPLDVLVTDLMMPDRDGFDVIRAARNARPGLRIVVLSSIDQRVPSDLTASALGKLGVDRVLRKPSSPEALVADIIAALAEVTADQTAP